MSGGSTVEPGRGSDNCEVRRVTAAWPSQEMVGVLPECRSGLHIVRGFVWRWGGTAACLVEIERQVEAVRAESRPCE